MPLCKHCLPAPLTPPLSLALLRGWEWISRAAVPGTASRQAGIDPYRVLGLDRSSAEELVRRRYRDLLRKIHPDTAGVEGTEFLTQMVNDAYRQILRERGWR